jgi:hypothetical protein
MKKLVTMLLAMGLLALLSLSAVAYADEGGKGKNGNSDNGKEDDKYVVLCQEKYDEFKLIKVKKDDLEKYLEDGAFFPKAKVLEEDKDKATVKFLCDNGDNGNNNGDHVKVLLCQEKYDEFKLIEVKKDDLEKYLEDGAFFPKAKVLEEDKDKATVKFLCDNGDNGNNNDNHVKVLLCQEKYDEFKLIEVKKDDLEKYLEDGAFFPKAKVLEEDKDKATVKFLCDNGDDKDDKKVIYPYQADKDDNGDKKNDYAAIGIHQSALVV